MIKSGIHTVLFGRLVQLFVLVLPVYPALCPLVIALMGINWLIALFQSGSIKSFFPSKFHMPLIMFFIWYAVALLWSQNLDSGSFEITTKLSFIFLPVFLAGISFDRNLKSQIFQSFVIGCFLACLLLLSMSTIEFFQMKNQLSVGEKVHDFGYNLFFKDRLSIFVHPSYFAMYLSFGIWLLYLNWNNLFFPIILRYVAVCLFIGVSILLVSKLGIISILIIAIFALYEMAIFRKKIRKALFYTVFLLTSASLVIAFVPQVNQRFIGAINSFINTDEIHNSDESTAARMAIWKASSALITKNVLLGSGTGSTNDLLWQEYQRQGLTSAFDQKLNAHNQFLQTFLTTGLPGLLLLIWMLFAPLRHTFLLRNRTTAGFFILIILNLLVESMFETQAGILFFVIFYLVMLSENPKEISNEIKL